MMTTQEELEKVLESWRAPRENSITIYTVGEFRSFKLLKYSADDEPALNEVDLSGGDLPTARAFAVWLIPAFSRIPALARQKGSKVPCYALQFVLGQHLSADQVLDQVTLAAAALSGKLDSLKW